VQCGKQATDSGPQMEPRGPSSLSPSAPLRDRLADAWELRFLEDAGAAPSPMPEGPHLPYSKSKGALGGGGECSPGQHASGPRALRLQMH